MQHTPYTYTLEKYKGAASRYPCPACGKAKQFTLYISTDTGQHLSNNVGICNRINNCGYHYTPQQYYMDNPQFKNCNPVNGSLTSCYNAPLTKINKPLYHRNTAVTTPKQSSFIPCILFDKSLCQYDTNSFALGLEKLFGTRLTLELIQQFKFGTAKTPFNSTIFWQVDEKGNVRTGKIMAYHPDTLKRLKKEVIPANEQNERNEQQKERSPVDWVHSRLLREKRVKGFHLQQCLFGLHQLTDTPADTLIGLVESEKTAIIASVYFPELVWMATGGACNLNAALLAPLKGRKVVLFPDVNQYVLWQDKAVNIMQQIGIALTVSDYLEIHATDAMRQNGADLADVLLRKDTATSFALSFNGYPIFWDR